MRNERSRNWKRDNPAVPRCPAGFPWSTVAARALDLRRVYVTPFLEWAGRLPLVQALKGRERREGQVAGFARTAK